eukprot:29576-Pelagococcus_subviridis.AAC.2
MSGEKRRAKSLRNGVHHANAVVRGPVYRTHLRRPRGDGPLVRRRRAPRALAKDVLHDLILERVKRYHAQSSPGRERVDRGGDRVLDRAELVVHGDSNPLKRPRRRVHVPAPSFLHAWHASDGAHERRRRQDGRLRASLERRGDGRSAVEKVERVERKGKERKGKERRWKRGVHGGGSSSHLADPPRDQPPVLLFAVVANHARDVLLRPLVHDVHRGERARRPHAHVQRPVVAEREPALGRVEMHRRYPEVEKDRVHLPVQLELVEAKAHRAEVVQHRVELEHARAPPRPRLGDLRRRRADARRRDGVRERIHVEADERDELEMLSDHRARVPARAHGAVDVRLHLEISERFQDLAREDRDVRRDGALGDGRSTRVVVGRFRFRFFLLGGGGRR